MRKAFYSLIRNIELLPVFIPIILFLCSWTLYKTIKQDEEVVKNTKQTFKKFNTFNINTDFVKAVKENHLVKSENSDYLPFKYAGILDSTLTDNNSSFFNFTKEMSTSELSDFAKSGYVGIIGNIDSERRDADASDNIFDIRLPLYDSNKSYVLTYDIDGYSDLNSVTRSVNGSYAMGGYIQKKNNGWVQISENIDPTTLKKGENKILFNALKKGDYYKVKNVKINELYEKEKASYTIVSQIYNENAIYIRGFINPKSGINAIKIHDQDIALQENEFEYFSKGNFKPQSVKIQFISPLDIKQVNIEKSLSETFSSDEKSYDNRIRTIVYSDKSSFIKGLRIVDLPPADLSLVNVSKDYEGFRFYNKHFSESSFHLDYDKNKLPKGYKEGDITAFNFDYKQKRWLPVQLDSLNTAKKYVVLHTSVATGDFMLAVAKQPASPETGGNAQNILNDTPIANPASKINLIAPPTPNQQGSSNLSYPIEIPAGIGGFQPHVSLAYNSDNKFGWAGTGWDVPLETIDLDTRWGVPSFGANETEIYLIAGEQLVFKDDYLQNKKPYSESRTSDRQFFYRNGIKEGYRITRMGNSPSGYTWVIIDGSGNKKEYLDFLTDSSSGNSSGNIVKWFLSKVTDRYGNTITYTYIDSFDGGGKNKYLSRINYSNNTVIEFENEGGIRGDMTFNYKLGVKLTAAKILNRILIKRANIKIREYQLLNSVEGAFKKRLLTEIIQKDGNGNLFNKHTLQYNVNALPFEKEPTKIFNTPKDNSDVGSFSGGNTSFIGGTYSRNRNVRGAISFGSGFCFFLGINKKGTLGFTGSYDDNRAYGKNQLLDIDGDGLLDKVFYSSNGNISYRKNNKADFGSIYSSSGLPAQTPIHRHNAYNTTIGLEYSFSGGVVGANYTTGNSNSPTYFSDVNGDGLVDMINYGDVYFSKIRNGLPQFQSQPLGSAANITEETPNAILAGNGAVQDTIITTTISSSLANVVRMWEAPVDGDIQITNGITLTQSSQDGVDVWIEKGEMRKINEDISNYSPAASSQISPILTFINQNQFQALNATTHVQKGQRVFIVASSRNNQDGDRVRIDSHVRYTSVSGVANLDLQDANNNYYFKFGSNSHYLASSQKTNIIGDKAKVSITWDALNSEIFTDDVDFKIYKSIRSISDTTSVIVPSSSTLIYHHKLLKDNDLTTVQPLSNEIPNFNITDFLVNQNPSDGTVTMLQFDVSSDTNVSWEKIRWRPTLTIKTDTDTTAIKALVRYNPYSERLINTLPRNFSKYTGKQVCKIKEDCTKCTDSSFLFPDFNGNNSMVYDYGINLSTLHNTKVTFSLKIRDGNGRIYTAKNTVDVINNVMPIPKLSLCELVAKTPLRQDELFSYPFYFEISSPDYIVAKALASVNPYIFHSEFLNDPNLANTDHKADYFAFRSTNTHYNINTGLVYQGWGGFSYNGSKFQNQPIRENEFATNPLANVPLPGGASPCNPSAPDYYTCMTNYIIQQNNNRYFTPLELNAEKYAYISPLEPVELTGLDVEPFLLGVSSSSSTIITTPVYSVPNPRGIVLRSSSDSFHAYAVGSIIPWMGISAHGGIFTDRTADYFQDFNGDGYPDIISGRFYQKTNVLGQLDVVSSIVKKEVKNKGFILGAGISASASVAKFSNTDSKFFAIGADKDSHTSSSSFALGIGVNLNIGKAWSQGTGVWADINGDGLIDYISDGNSYINNGYGFVADNYSWNVSEVSKGESFAVSGGGGISFANGSWAAGIGLSKSTSTATVGLIDVNGDGLADKIVKNGNSYEMWINNGTSFIPPNNIGKDVTISNKQNSSGFNFYGTICGCFGVKICVSVGGGTDNSVSKQEVDLRDFDGDGYPDLLISDNDNQLTFYHNNYATANLLLTVENPLQGTIMLGYSNVNQDGNLSSLIGGTYQMPFSKTVLSRVAIGNFRPIDTTLPYLGQVLDPQKIKPAQIINFQYEKGIQDRREREFLGFGLIKSITYNGLALHQTQVVQYETDYSGSENNFYVNFDHTKVRQYYYKKGLIRSSYLLDSQNRKRSETKYTYKYIDQSNSSGYQLSESLAEPQYKDIGRIIPLLYKTESTFTEFVGSSNHSKTTINTVEAYDKYGNVIQSTDRGATLSYAPDDVRTQITYHSPGVRNIVGIPSEQIVVTVDNNEVVRKTSTLLNASQNIIRIKKDLLGSGSASGTADFDMEYDSYGNMTKVTHPASENGQRMVYNYVYDPLYHTYLISTVDSHNFASSIEYDNNYLFGVPTKITNINGAISEFTYDSFGRVTKYLAPLDNDWTIKMFYFPSQTIPVAITERKATQYANLRPNYFTSLFTDAWGEGLMSKKLYKQEGGSNYYANNIYQIKDKLGRPVKTILRDKITTGTPADVMTSLQIFDDYTTAEDKAAQTYSTTTYDDLNRPLTVVQHNVNTSNGVQNLTTQMLYEFGTDRYGNVQFSTKVVSPLGNTNVSYNDEYGRTTSTKQVNGNENIWVSYRYDRLNQLRTMEDMGNHPTEYSYDKFGRNIKKVSPDTGESGFTYDLSGKLIKSYNANLKSLNAEIYYRYNFDQLVEIEYPEHKVNFVYGEQGNTAVERGKLLKQTDKTGTQEYKYDIFGNVRETKRIVVASNNVPKMFKTSFDYDVFGRITKIIYPDTEEVSYYYNMGGLLENVQSKLPGYSKPTNIIHSLDYDNRDQLKSYLAANGTKTTYDHDSWGRVNELSLLYTNGNVNIRKNQYTFDGNDNLSSVQGTTPMSGNYPSMDLGIATNKQYTYDTFGRLNTAQITAKGNHLTKYYDLDMGYNAVGNMASKNSRLKTYDNSISCQYPGNEGDLAEYLYNHPSHPNAVSEINYTKYANFTSPLDCGLPQFSPAINNSESFRYDENGNLILLTEIDSHNNSTSWRELFWDHENRLKAVATENKNFSYYNYDASGERILKNDARTIDFYVNGNNPEERTEMGFFTYYPNGYLVLDGKYMSKHYYMGTTRIASRVSQIPTHRFKINLSGEYNDLAGAMHDEINQLIELSNVPGAVWNTNEDSQGTYTPPTSSTQDNNLCSFLIEQQIYTFLQDGNEECFNDLSEYYANATQNGNFCDAWAEYLTKDCMVGYTPPEVGLESEMYWIHPDHFSGASILVNSIGNVTNWYEYMPFGEMLMENTNFTYDNPYKYNAKELDMATGYYYYGARYYDPKRSFWLSVDPLAEITNSPYAYVWNDPVNFADPTGLMGERVGGPKDGPKTVKDCFGSKDYLDDPEKRLSAYIKSKGGVEAFAPQRPKLTKNDWQNKFELWNYNNELTAWKKMSYEQKLQRVRTDVTLQELNQAIRGDAQAMADLFTIQADLGGSGIATGNVSSYFRKWRSLKDNNFVGSLANRLGRYVKAIDEPYSFSGGMGDVDIVTKSFNIEVKSGNKMKITQSLKNKEFSKTEGKDYILYMPKATNKQIYEASKKGIKVIKTEKALIKAIK